MKEFKELVSLCSNSVEINVNNHRDFYQTAEECIDEMNLREYASEDVINKMIELNVIVGVIAYPNGAVSSYRVYHYDIDEAMKQMLTILRK